MPLLRKPPRRLLTQPCIVKFLGPVDSSFQALSGRLKFAVRRHTFNTDSLSAMEFLHRKTWTTTFQHPLRLGGGMGLTALPPFPMVSVRAVYTPGSYQSLQKRILYTLFEEMYPPSIYHKY